MHTHALSYLPAPLGNRMKQQTERGDLQCPPQPNCAWSTLNNSEYSLGFFFTVHLARIIMDKEDPKSH